MNQPATIETNNFNVRDVHLPDGEVGIALVTADGVAQATAAYDLRGQLLDGKQPLPREVVFMGPEMAKKVKKRRLQSEEDTSGVTGAAAAGVEAGPSRIPGRLPPFPFPAPPPPMRRVEGPLPAPLREALEAAAVTVVPTSAGVRPGRSVGGNGAAGQTGAARPAAPIRAGASAATTQPSGIGAAASVPEEAERQTTAEDGVRLVDSPALEGLPNLRLYDLVYRQERRTASKLHSGITGPWRFHSYNESGSLVLLMDNKGTRFTCPVEQLRVPKMQPGRS